MDKKKTIEKLKEVTAKIENTFYDGLEKTGEVLGKVADKEAKLGFKIVKKLAKKKHIKPEKQIEVFLKIATFLPSDLPAKQEIMDYIEEIKNKNAEKQHQQQDVEQHAANIAAERQKEQKKRAEEFVQEQIIKSKKQLRAAQHRWDNEAELANEETAKPFTKIIENATDIMMYASDHDSNISAFITGFVNMEKAKPMYTKKGYYGDYDEVFDPRIDVKTKDGTFVFFTYNRDTSKKNEQINEMNVFYINPKTGNYEQIESIEDQDVINIILEVAENKNKEILSVQRRKNEQKETNKNMAVMLNQKLNTEFTRK